MLILSQDIKMINYFVEMLFLYFLMIIMMLLLLIKLEKFLLLNLIKKVEENAGLLKIKN